MSEPKYITLREWAADFTKPPLGAASLRTIRKLGRIQPRPFRVGRTLYVEQDALYLVCGPVVPEGWEPPPVVAVKRQIARAKETWLYRHYDVAGRLLYVGVSLSPIERLRKHAGASHWAHDIARVEIEVHADRRLALAAEKSAIKAERPAHNITHARKSA